MGIVSVAKCAQDGKPQKPILTSPNTLGGEYHRNLMRLTGVPTMTLIWVTKHSYSAPMRERLEP
jgi:hypothetical protein